MMRILLVNPNTTPAVTETIAVATRLAASPGTEIKPVTARFGASIIGTRVETAVSAAAAIDQLAREANDCDAAIIGASVDSGCPSWVRGTSQRRGRSRGVLLARAR